MQTFAREQRIKDALSLQRETEAKLEAIRAKEERARKRMASGESRPKRTVSDFAYLLSITRSKFEDRNWTVA